MTELKIENPDVEELAPSAKLVYLIVQEGEPAGPSEIADRTLLPPRTVRWALDRLLDQDLITARTNPGDARRTLYETA